jgi:uncharacterized protein
MRVVIDTNIFVSGLINSSGFPAQVVDLFLAREIQALFDDRILSEYADILYSEKLAFPIDKVSKLLEFIKHDCIYVDAKLLSIHLPDPDDQPFLEVARAGAATAIITGNLRHYPNIAEAQSPKDFILSWKQKHS